MRKERGAQARKTELVAIKLFAKHLRLADDVLFRLVPDTDSVVDAQIRTLAETMDLQITVADPALAIGKKKNNNPGYQRQLLLEMLKQQDEVAGLGPFRRDDNRIIDDSEEDDSSCDYSDVCHQGLILALNNKSPSDGRGCSLLIHSRSYCECIYSPAAFVALVKSATEAGPELTFDRIYVMDYADEYFTVLEKDGSRAE
jgi:hypothetical protein